MTLISRIGARVSTESMRTKLVDAATWILEERGLTGLTIREVARAAGVSEGSVYNHFEDKVDLVNTVFVERMPKIKLRAAVHKLVTGTGREDPLIGLVEFAVAAIDAYREIDTVAGQLAADRRAAAGLRTSLAKRNVGPGRGVQAVVAYLRIEEERGRLTLAGPPSVVGAALLGGCHEYAFMEIFHERSPFGELPEEFAAQLVGTLVRPGPGE
jgi:AcrR family transcriptional regulator